MGKRYGRNQKRKHREEIAQLRETHNMDVSLMGRLTRRSENAEQTVQEVFKTIGNVCKNSIAIPPKDIEVNRALPNHFSVEQSPSLSEFGPIENHTIREMSNEFAQYRVVDLYRLEIFVEDNRDQMGKAVHVTLSNGKHSAYMISDSALASISTMELTDRLLPEVTVALVRHLKS